MSEPTKTEDPLCANCGHSKSKHYHQKYSHARGFGDVCHAMIWKRGRQKECGCPKFVPFKKDWPELIDWAKKIRKESKS